MAGIFHISISGFIQVKGDQNGCFSIALVTKCWGVFWLFFFPLPFWKAWEAGWQQKQYLSGGTLSSPGSHIWATEWPGQPSLQAHWGSRLAGHWDGWGHELCQDCPQHSFSPPSGGPWTHGAGTLYFLSGCFLARGAQAFEFRTDLSKHCRIFYTLGPGASFNYFINELRHGLSVFRSLIDQL